jgi:hypothetical protein
MDHDWFVYEVRDVQGRVHVVSNYNLAKELAAELCRGRVQPLHVDDPGARRLLKEIRPK